MPIPNQNKQLVKKTSAPGESNAAIVKLDERTVVEVFYDIGSSDDDMYLAVSEDMSNWKVLDSVAASTLDLGGESGFIGPHQTTYTYAKAYSGGAFSLSEINVIEISVK